VAEKMPSIVSPHGADAAEAGQRVQNTRPPPSLCHQSASFIRVNYPAFEFEAQESRHDNSLPQCIINEA
jgi:hypothetical protein